MRGAVRPLAALIIVALTSAAPAEEIVAPATRNVTPAGMMPGPTGEGPLIREAVPPKPPAPPRWRRYFLPVTTDAATFAVKNLTIRVAGVAAPAADSICGLPDGTDWPCGRTALFAFRKFLHGRAVECLFPYVPDATDITAPCRIGKIDLASWLLAQGWAKPSDLATDDYRKASVEAQCTGIGIWRGTAPPATCEQD